MQRSKVLALTFLVGTLLCGGALGFSADRMLSRNACQNPGDHAAMRKWLADRLDLSPVQRSTVDSILDVRHREMSRIIDPVRPQLDSARGAARAQIMKVLDARQQTEFKALIDESRRQEAARSNR